MAEGSEPTAKARIAAARAKEKKWDAVASVTRKEFEELKADVKSINKRLDHAATVARTAMEGGE